MDEQALAWPNVFRYQWRQHWATRRIGTITELSGKK